MQQIFPKEILNSTVEVHQFKHNSRSKIIYSIILSFILLALGALPLIKVSVFNTSRGILKPNKERVSLTLISSGEILFSNLRNNQKVNKGDTLLVLNSSDLEEQMALLELQINETEAYIKDLEYLINERTANLKDLTSNRYKKEYLVFIEKKDELRNIYQKEHRDHMRNSTLYEKGVISKVDHENAKFKNDVALNDIRAHKAQTISSWQLDLSSFKNDIEELSSNRKRLEQEKKNYVLTASIKGTILKAKGLTNGMFINQGMELGEISPDSNLIVECYIAPNDIGLLDKNKSVNFQIDTFNYNQWGLVKGEILEIGNDIEIVDNNPVFKVLCKINIKYLQLNNGFKGHLKKGMTLNARFELAERTLFSLLYDKVDDWMNPGTNNLEHAKNNN